MTLCLSSSSQCLFVSCHSHFRRKYRSFATSEPFYLSDYSLIFKVSGFEASHWRNVRLRHFRISEPCRPILVDITSSPMMNIRSLSTISSLHQGLLLPLSAVSFSFPLLVSAAGWCHQFYGSPVLFLLCLFVFFFSPYFCLLW